MFDIFLREHLHFMLFRSKMLIFIFIISKQGRFYNSIKPSYDFGHKRYFAPYMPGRSKILSFINI